MAIDMKANAPIRVALVDDHAIVRTGLRRLIELEDQLQVVAEFADAESAYAALAADLADVAVLDLSMPGRDGMEILRRLKIRQPELKIVVFSMHDSVGMVRQALRAGADGYFSKGGSSPEALVAALARIANGQCVVADDLRRALEKTQSAGAAVGVNALLTPREFDVYRLMVAGGSVAGIAGHLNLSAKTVSNYQTIIRQKLGAESALDLLLKAQAANLPLA